jgi:hypothetical protein
MFYHYLVHCFENCWALCVNIFYLSADENCLVFFSSEDTKLYESKI